MKKMSVLIGALLITVLMATTAFAGGNSKVAYTWTIADLGQGVWGGGPLYADGSAGGNLAFSIANGQVVGYLQPTTWHEYEADGQAAVDICFTLHEIKGDSELPPQFCTIDQGVVLLVNGTPGVFSFPDSPQERTLIRVTRTN